MRRPHTMTALLAALVIVLAATPANADASLIDSSPKDGSTIKPGRTTQVVFTFNQKLQDIGVFTAATGPDGKSVIQGKPQVERGELRQQITTETPGDYKASYRVVSTDGHPVSGTINFTVETTTPGTPPTTAPTASNEVEGQSKAESSPTDEDSPPWKIIAILTAAALTVVLAARSLRRRDDST